MGRPHERLCCVAAFGKSFYMMLRTAWAYRRDAPPGFRAAPRAAFAVTAIRLQSLTPSRLRRCALRLPPGESPAGYPRRAQLGAPTRNRRIGQASAPPRWAGLVELRPGLLRQVVRKRAVLDAGDSLPVHHEGRFTDSRPGLAMELPRHASRPAPQGAAEAFSPVVG